MGGKSECGRVSGSQGFGVLLKRQMQIIARLSHSSGGDNYSNTKTY